VPLLKFKSDWRILPPKTLPPLPNTYDESFEMAILFKTVQMPNDYGFEVDNLPPPAASRCNKLCKLVIINALSCFFLLRREGMDIQKRHFVFVGCGKRISAISKQRLMLLVEIFNVCFG